MKRLRDDDVRILVQALMALGPVALAVLLAAYAACAL